MNDDKPVRIVRAPHKRDFFVHSRETAQDKSISFEALGVLTYLLSQSDSWQANVRDIAKRSTKYKVYKILRELRQAGYVTLSKEQGKGRFSQWVYQVYETKQQVIELQQVENQLIENRHTKRIQRNTENTKKKETIHASSDAKDSKPPIKRHYFEAVAKGVFEVSEFKGLSPASLKRIGLLEKTAKGIVSNRYPTIDDEQGALLVSKYCAAEKFKPNLKGQTQFELGLTAFLEKNEPNIPSFLASQATKPPQPVEPTEFVDPEMVKKAMAEITAKFNANDVKVAS